jgi:hypothetical protein
MDGELNPRDEHQQSGRDRSLKRRAQKNWPKFEKKFSRVDLDATIFLYIKHNTATRALRMVTNQRSQTVKIFRYLLIIYRSLAFKNGKSFKFLSAGKEQARNDLYP